MYRWCLPEFITTFWINNTQIATCNSIEDENFQIIKNSTSLTSFNASNYRHSQNINFKDIETILGNYDEREKLVIDKINNKKNDLRNEISRSREIEEKLKHISIKELFKQFKDIKILDNAQFENKELMHYLLSYGYIDENYEEYISNFFGVSITKDEQEFLRNVKNSGKAFPFDYELKNLQEIVKFRLSINEFSNESVLNVHLMEHLLENKILYPQQVKKLFQQISDESESSKEFILYCLDNSTKKIEFVKLIVKHYQQLGVYIFLKQNLE
jgi:hypothetical protein